MRFIYTKTFAVFAASLVAVFLLMLIHSKGWLEPVRTAALRAPRPLALAVRAVTLPIKNFFGTLFRLHAVVKENAELENKIILLQQNLATSQQNARENEALKKELGFSRSSKLKLEPCSVLAQNPLDLTDTIVIDCGSEKGIQEGYGVLSQGYLAGKVVFAGKNTSTVLLATNSKFSTDAKISASGSGGVVRGSYGSGMILDQLPQNSETPEGGIVVTGGINDKIPRSILIGEMGTLISGANDLFKKVTLSSPVDFSDLKFVFVAKP